METKIIFIIVILTVFVVSFYGFINKWSWYKIAKYVVFISATIAPLALIDNYRIFIIAFLLALVFEYKNLNS